MSRKKKEFPGFLLYFDRITGIFEKLEDNQLGYVMRIIYNYARYGTEPQNIPAQYAVVWPTLQDMVDSDREAYEYKCAQGAHAAACREAMASGLPKPDKDEFIEEYRKTHNLFP